MDQIDDNLYVVRQSGVARLDYHLKSIPSYSRVSNFKSFNIPPEIWERILDITCMELLSECNYKILARLLLVSRSYMQKFYYKFFGRDTHILQKISDPDRYFRVSHTLKTLHGIISMVNNSFSNRVELQMDPRCGIFPNPWEIIKVDTLHIKCHATIYTPDAHHFNPHRYQIGQGVAFMDGIITNSVIRATYLRVPTIILRTTGPRGRHHPIMSPMYLTYSQAWKSFKYFLSRGLGDALGVYHAIASTHLPDELIFHGEVIMET